MTALLSSAPASLSSRIESGNELVLERVFAAPRELLFTVFSQAEHLRQWWGPRGWEVPYCTVDFRPGGRWHYCMKCVDETQGEFFGMESWGLGIYRDIEAPSRIIYTDYFSDAQGNMNEDLPATLSTLSFEEVEGGTKLINRAAYASEENLKTVVEMGMLHGIADTWDRLAEYLEVRRA